MSDPKENKPEIKESVSYPTVSNNPWRSYGDVAYISRQMLEEVVAPLLGEKYPHLVLYIKEKEKETK